MYFKMTKPSTIILKRYSQKILIEPISKKINKLNIYKKFYDTW